MAGRIVVVGAVCAVIGLAVGFVAGPRLTGGDDTAKQAAGGTAVQDAAAPGPALHWKMASVVPSSMMSLGSHGKRFEEQIAAVSGGSMDIRFFEPGALVPPFEVFDAVSTGAADAGWSVAGYWAGKVPAAVI